MKKSNQRYEQSMTSQQRSFISSKADSKKAHSEGDAWKRQANGGGDKRGGPTGPTAPPGSNQHRHLLQRVNTLS